ncbi:MAG TPA: HAD family hydrolase [Gemmatimonadales bacterium]|nr:HAD family hydrolase [Gemmatimonadales bacterium]
MRGLVLFDFGGTLDADGARWSIRFHAAYRAAGGRQSFAAFEKVFRESDRALGRYSGIERLGFRAMVDAQAALLLARLPDGAGLSPQVIADQFHSTTCAVVRRNEALLERLQQSYHLGVVSNFTGNLALCLEELGVMKYFSVVADSGRVGVTKPDSRLFRHALTFPGLVASPAWMVGDNFESDIRPAAALGMSTAWLAPEGTKSPEAGLPTVRLKTLADLAAVLDR